MIYPKRVVSGSQAETFSDESHESPRIHVVVFFMSVHVSDSVCCAAVQTFGEKLLGMFSVIMPISVALSTFGGINGYLFTSSR